jgi:outer membrane protein insertion porin family
MKKIGVSFILLFILSNITVQAQESFEVTDLRVEGLSRITAETILSYLPVGVGDKVDEEKSRQIIKALFKTGFFKDIKLHQEAGVMAITVIERPSISVIRVTGNKDLDDERIGKMLDEEGIMEGRIVSESSLERFIRELNNFYISRGRYGTQIETAIIPLDKNRVDVAIQIDEGKVARVREIRFVGNSAFEDSVLRRKSVFYGNVLTNLLLGRNKFSQEKLAIDLESWRNFYLDRGFLEFEIVSNDISIDSDKTDVLLTVVLSEGVRYRVGRIAVDGTEVTPAEAMRDLLEIRGGMLFSRKAVTDSRVAIEKTLANAGYAFANVNPIPDPDRDSKIVNIAFVIDPGPKVYVRRINIVGNTSTQDVVIRRELRQMEGALYSSQKIQRSRERINRLGLFDEVSAGVVPVTGATDKVDLNFDVVESKTGNLMLGVGYSDDERGFVQAEVSRRNLFGSGREIDISLDRSQIKQSYEVEYVNPYYTADGISRAIFARKNIVDGGVGTTAGYVANSTTFGLRYRIPTSEYNALDLSGAYEKIDLIGIETTPSEYTSFINEHPSSNGVVIAGAFARDTRDKILFPKKGYISKVAAETAIPGSNLEYYKISLRTRWYRPLAEDLVLGLSGTVGYGGGYGNVGQFPFYKNFFAGGASSIRGFAAGSLGPRAAGQASGDPLGGSRKLLANANLYFPVPGLENGDKARLSLFMDTGQVYGNAEPVSVSEFRTSVGFAFNWFTAVGPLVLSYGLPLNAEPSDRTREFQITLGTLFR